eukprot:4625761-Amphidinium_carterae.1
MGVFAMHSLQHGKRQPRRAPTRAASDAVMSWVIGRIWSQTNPHTPEQCYLPAAITSTALSRCVLASPARATSQKTPRNPVLGMMPSSRWWPNRSKTNAA